jgi:AcrR family transcriptional regulator
MTDAKAKTSHHHGNLKDALIKAGIELLEDGGIDALSLRKCAARAGVSHAAPAHHFDGLAGLKAAIAEEGFRLFSNSMRSACDQGEQSPRGRLRSICRGYLQFGLDHGGILNVIFGARGLAGLSGGQGREGANAYQILRETCAPFVRDGEDPAAKELQVWSLIHGFTMLTLAEEFGPRPKAAEDGPFNAVVALLDQFELPAAS